MKKYVEIVCSVLVTLAMVAIFATSVSVLDGDRQKEGKQQLEEVLRKTAVACYASEGFYPPDLEYMRLNYGLRYDEAQYVVYYNIFASNLMPDITVLDK